MLPCRNRSCAVPTKNGFQTETLPLLRGFDSEAGSTLYPGRHRRGLFPGHLCPCSNIQLYLLELALACRPLHSDELPVNQGQVRAYPDRILDRERERFLYFAALLIFGPRWPWLSP